MRFQWLFGCACAVLFTACDRDTGTTNGGQTAVVAADLSGEQSVEQSDFDSHRTELPPIQLFESTLKGAERSSLRESLKRGGMRAKREDEKFWTDTYDPRGVLEGASAFEVGYIDATETFAFAEYTFSSFMDVQQVQRVADLVTQKYGAPTSVIGNVQVGDVAFRWERNDGMAIEVSRGWPATTTYLSFIDEVAFRAMKAEQLANSEAEKASKAESQTQAF